MPASTAASAELIVAALAIGAYLLWKGEPEITTQRVLYVEGVWLGIGLVGGALFAWLLPYLVQSKNAAPYVFVSPFFILFFVFGLGPIAFSAILSFLRWEPASGLSGMAWGGFDGIWPSNYAYAASDRLFVNSLKNTAIIAVASGLPQHFVGMPLAYFFHVAYTRFRNAVTGAYFLPFITSSVAISLIFNTLFSKDFGVVNASLDALHRLTGIGPAEHIDWLGKAPYTKPAVSFVVFWRYLGWNTVLYLSALQAISKDLFEAAEMDGATRWQTFTRVILPAFLPAVITGFALSFARGLGEYGSVVFISGNMPYRTEIAPLLIVTKLEQFDYAGAAAIASVMLVASFLLLLTINFLQWWSTRSRES